MEIFLGVVILVLSLYLVFAVLMQSGKDKQLSGTIAGGADNIFGKTKANKWDKFFSLSTLIVGIVYGVIVIAMYIMVS